MTYAQEKRKKEEEKDHKGTKPIGLEDVNTSTRLLDKHYSPLIVRKYQMFGWPLFVSLICDLSLSDLDEVVLKFKKDHGQPADDIQAVRNFCGLLSDHVVKHYESRKDGCVEGIAVLLYADKCFISSLYGDFMTHSACKAELFAIINTLPHI